MPAQRRLGAALLILGLGLIVVSQLVAGAFMAPLFDGLVVEDPYRYVEPPPSGAADPFAASAVEQVVNGAVPLVAIATEETPPQAQMIAQADAFAVAAGIASIAVSIAPLGPTDPRIGGNIYRFAVTDQAGAALDVVPGAVVTIVLRAPLPDPAAVIARLDGGQWVALPTQHGGLPDLFAANISQVGDFAILMSGAAPSASGPGPSATVAAPSPSPSGGSGGKGGGGIPTWVIVLFAIAAVAAGLTWGLVMRGEDD
jgi:hypothetical protein